MVKNWKRALFWSSLGSVAIGAAVALVRKPKQRDAREFLCRPIPADCDEVVIWTERFQAGEMDQPDAVARDKYMLQRTLFKLWSVLDVGLDQGKPAGAPIYHVSRYRLVDRAAGAAVAEEERPVERFYGTVATRRPGSEKAAGNCIGRGGRLEIEKCYVGGSSNGVLSGEIHVSSGPILNFRFRRIPV